MKKKPFNHLLAILLWSIFSLLPGKGIANDSDTTEGRYFIVALKATLNGQQNFSCTVDYSTKMNTPSFQTTTYQIKAKRDLIISDHGGQLMVQDQAYSFSVDTINKKIYLGGKRDLFTAIMGLSIYDGKFWEANFSRSYVVDTGSLKKLVLECKPESSFGIYLAVYDPTDLQIKQVKYTLKNRRPGVLGDDVFLFDFRNYQTTLIDESIFDHTRYFRRINGVLELSEAYATYELIDYPKP